MREKSHNLAKPQSDLVGRIRRAIDLGAYFRIAHRQSKRKLMLEQCIPIITTLVINSFKESYGSNC